MSAPNTPTVGATETPSPSNDLPGTVTRVDVRGPRFVAWITTAVLAAAIVVASFSPVVAGIVLALQAVVFAIGAALGPHRGPYGRVFRALVVPRLTPVTETEPVAPLRFAQTVGFVFAAVGAIAMLAGVVAVGFVAAGFALFAALLNAAFGFCLGCTIYPLVLRLRPAH
ncbi:DUF4395 domain-containing protein [Rhodococcus rhodnii]|uniref:DUF4395 domain-containing protein n=2 Tax=Rhodococcus rhodnii TaxID=38312 RepID=R7WH90_9NOCA|nr:DUF4395 domain-containing protein [Rhodococcus rhodnii]EOM74382.1 hypothetical protein Rrhod_4184 [Rhodococcus rhodnii LMG 5362]TXG89103.1 DUF4395 domain-containing protein [Rhodococcus rhodnii]